MQHKRHLHLPPNDELEGEAGEEEEDGEEAREVEAEAEEEEEEEGGGQAHSGMHPTTQHQPANKAARPLSISSISSAASSGSSSSSNSSSSSGIHSSLTRNSSLNYSQEFRKQSFLASIESLDSAQLLTACSSSSCVAGAGKDACPTGSHHVACNHAIHQNAYIELALKSLQLNQHHHHNQFRDVSSAATRAAVLAAGESQRRGFGSTAPGNRAARINRSFHASLRYDKNTAYRIHMMTNARALQHDATQSASQDGACAQADSSLEDELRCCGPSISRNNSSTSSDSGHARQGFRDVESRRFSCHVCRCYQLTRVAASPSIASTESSASLNDGSSSSTISDKDSQTTGAKTPKSLGMSPLSSNQKPTTTATTTTTTTTTALDDAYHRADASGASANGSNVIQAHQMHRRHYQMHHPDCTFSNKPKRASAKLQQSPSSVSSHSNTSSLFRDDGFEDDLNSTASEHSSTVYHKHQHLDRHRPVFYHQNQNHHISLQNHHIESELGSSPSITQRVVTEIIETERSYVDDLEQIVTGYLCNLRDTLEQHKDLFSNLEEVYKFNKDLLFQLEECYLNPGAVAACFVENSLKFDVYTHYCTMYPQVVSTLTQLMADPTAAQILKERQLELNQSLPLGAYLLKPVQRILKYHILFKSLIKYTTDDETVVERDRELINEAFSVMTNIACHINEMKKKHEHSIRVQELQGLLCGWEGPDLTTLGELILEDSFKLYNRQKSSRHLLLFDNVLLITKKKRDGSLCYKGHIECSNLMLIETIEGQPLVFNTVPFDNPKALCAFQADNLEKKRDWCLQMKEVIIKSFEVKIPAHVRDLLMSLTKGNAGDSNASISKTSPSEAAKAIRAPNYLDRKRNKQDKKK